MSFNKIVTSVFVSTVCVNTSLMFATEGDDSSRWPGRVLAKAIVVAATPDQVWQAWTTADGLTSFFPEEALIDIAIGGRWELHMSPDAPKGKQGSEGCTILSFVPGEMLAFTWNAPPKVAALREAGVKTQVVLRFNAQGKNRTRIRLTQSGMGQGEDWDAYYEYFDSAWTYVLGNLHKKFQSDSRGGEGPSTDKQARDDASAGEAVRTWEDDGVTISVREEPMKRQDFDITIDAPVERVWRALATSEGMSELMQRDAEVELMPGGQYSVWSLATNRVLAFVPGEMLSVSGSAPEKFPNVRKGGTWAMYSFESAGENRTRLRLAVLGWKPGDPEWDAAFDYFLKANPQYLRMVRDKLQAP